MRVNNKNIDVIDAINFTNYDNLLLKRRNNNFLLSDYQVEVLNNYGINYNKFKNLHELLFQINVILNINYQEDLDYVASQINEILYYTETKK